MPLSTLSLYALHESISLSRRPLIYKLPSPDDRFALRHPELAVRLALARMSDVRSHGLGVHAVVPNVLARVKWVAAAANSSLQSLHFFPPRNAGHVKQAIQTVLSAGDALLIKRQAQAVVHKAKGLPCGATPESEPFDAGIAARDRGGESNRMASWMP